ncbi:MAG: 2-isopropylmalate synthase, partial [Candidatus Gastranaerophilales bacterium]|nr:2-isopropylmalate synthase [Candidatus Gastranaerophilales bacterium]
MQRKPFFYDITLRDGNQSLKKPWSLEEKIFIFDKITSLGIKAIEIGFPASSQMDFDACQTLANRASEDVLVSVLARAHQGDIDRALEAIKDARKARLHTFITLSPFHMEHVLNKTPGEAAEIAINADTYAKQRINELNKN